MGRLPAQCLLRVRAGRRLVGREDHAERAVGLGRHGLDGQTQSPADDRGDVAYGVALIGYDTAQDVVPSGYSGIRIPIHAVGITAMGLWLLDNCDLERLAATCAELSTWQFELVTRGLLQ